MNILSIISTIIYTTFFIGAIVVVRAERKSVMNLSACAVLIALGWWSFSNSFFFGATTSQDAMFWHKLSSIGWSSFVAFTTYYFLALTTYDRKLNVWWKKMLFMLPAIVLVVHNLFGVGTSLALDIIPSTSGLGWTYENSLTNIWLWVYMIYVLSYFGFAFYLLAKWAEKVQHRMKKEMAIMFIFLDAITILCGVFSDVISPLTNQAMPSIANISTIIFGIGYFAIIYRYDVFNINLVISSDDILQTSSNMIFVIDENKEILKYNNAVTCLLGYNGNELIGQNFMKLFATEIDLYTFYFNKKIINIESEMKCKDGKIKNMLISASVANDRYNSFLCLIVSIQDVTTQIKMQEELIVEREKFEKLANEYQKLSYYDLLTGLANRRRFYEVLQTYEDCYKKDGTDFSVIFLDMDNFKHVNDVYGHKGGDELLQATAKKLLACVDGNEFVARLGGDEFIIVMAIQDKHCVQKKIEVINEEFKKKIDFAHETYEIYISCGSGIYSEIKNIDKLMQQADEAMYMNKRKKDSTSIII
ncbi:MAG: diguanylate cyclase [Longicatena sp.]